MLRLVIPISSADCDIATRLLKHLSEESDSARNRPLTLILAKPLFDRVEEFRTLGLKITDDVSVSVLTSEKTGWPQGPNHMFQGAVQHLFETGNKSPWIWVEADSTPLTRNWVDTIELEYNTARLPYMGTARTSILRDSTGEPHGTDGEYLIGVAVYPPDFHNRSLLWRFLSQYPFDIYCRWEIRPRAHVSDLFAHNWKASNFRGDRKKGFVWDGEDQTPIPANSVLHHGCKDGSFLKAAWTTTVETPKAKPPVIKLEVPDDDED